MATPTVQRHLCQLCDRRIGAYSETRRMYVCESCWRAMGRQEIAFERSIADRHWIEEEDL